MASPADRFSSWIESLASAWKERLAGWMMGWTSAGIRKSLDELEPGIIEQTQETVQKLLANPNLPPETRRLLEKAIEKGNIFEVVLGWTLTIIGTIPALLGQGAPLGRIFEADQEILLRSQKLDPLMALQYWRRDKEKNAEVLKDLQWLGWSEERIEVMKTITEIIPNAADVVRFAVREVYSPEIAEKFGQFEDFPIAAMPDAARAGVSEPLLKNYWAAHWDLPGATLGYELLHRGIITEDDLKVLLRALDIMPYWRDKLIKLSWNIPTRVDVRRFWDMRTIDEVRLREIYTGLGYHGRDLDDYVLWTKIFTDFPDLLARYKNGWITIDQVRSELIAMGMKPERAETMIQEKMKNAMIERTATEKNLTKADIIGGVKKNVITRAEGAELLVSIGYSADEAEYILAVNIPVDEEDATKAARELTKSDIAAAVKERLLSPAQAIVKLMALRYKEADATFLAAIYAAQIPIEKIQEERELSKGDVATGLKAGIISPEEARIMLTTLRYSTEDIDFLLKVNAAEAALAAKEKQRQVEKSDVRAALKAGVIADDEAISRLVKLEYSEADAKFLVNLYNTIDSLSIVTKPKEVSKADIVTAVKKGLITPAEGYVMLVSLGFSAEAATFILSLVAEESPFSPMNFSEFQDRAQKWRKAVGLEGKPMNEEIRKAAAEVIRLTGERDALVRSIAAEKRGLLTEGGIPVEATARLTQLQGSLHQAEAELSRVKADYSRLAAEVKHTAR